MPLEGISGDKLVCVLQPYKILEVGPADDCKTKRKFGWRIKRFFKRLFRKKTST